LSATDSEAAYAPAAAGLNVTEIEQFVPAGKVLPHVFVCRNDAEFVPAILMPEIVSVAVPGFCIEIVRVLEPPTAKVGKVIEEDEKDTSGASVAIEKFNEFDIPPPGAGFVTVTTAVPAFATRADGTVAVKTVPVTKVVVRETPFHFTVEPETKLVPFTVS